MSLEISEFDKSTYILRGLNSEKKDGEDIIWEREDYPDLAYAEVMEGEFEEVKDFFFQLKNLLMEKEPLILRK